MSNDNPNTDDDSMPFSMLTEDEQLGALKPVVSDAEELSELLGLDPYPVKWWLVENEEMNELIAYNGFQKRYPHWRWGFQYLQQSQKSQYGGGKVFEIVNNDNPAHAFLQKSNTLADQKGVITHVYAHLDFFKNNQWFPTDPDAVDMLARHADRIREYMDDPEIGVEAVEEWIDHILCIEDTIDQYSEPQKILDAPEVPEEADDSEDLDPVDALDISQDVRDAVFDEDFEMADMDEEDRFSDVLAFFLLYGKQYDEESGKAVEMEAWQKDVLGMMRKEAYYFGPQKMTKTMNEGWASFWESVMMADELFADDNEFITYADHQSAVLASPGFNPYKLGNLLWSYIENKTNRREVIDKLLRIEGVNWKTIDRKIDYSEVLEILDESDSDDPVKRHYSLTRPQNREFLQSMPAEELKEMSRYMFDINRYNSVEEALEDVNYSAGWDRMFEIRETHNDITFIDEFMTPEFTANNDLYTYEFNHKTGDYRMSSRDLPDVKKKMLLQFSNFGKPTIVAADKNYNNTNELMLHHDYNGIMLNIEKMKKVLERIFNLWGRSVNLKTIVKKVDSDGELVEEGRLFRYDAEKEEVIEGQLDWEDVEDIKADDIDYDTRPDDW